MHHLTQDMKQLLSEAQVAIPLLSPARHGFCDTESLDPEAEKICGAYREQVALGTADNEMSRNIKIERNSRSLIWGSPYSNVLK